jgi:protein ImuB
VLHAPAVRGSMVAACCRAAVVQGVRVGMPLAEAKSLVRDLAIEPYDAATDSRKLLRLAGACERFSPCVAIEEGDKPESLLLDLTNLGHLLGTEAEIAEKVEQFFAAEGYQVQWAIAETVGLAWAMAHSGSDCKMQNAKCKLQIAEGLLIEGLRITDDAIDLLHQLGIENMGQLLALPREDLTSRFGEQLLRRVNQLLGNAPEVLVPYRDPAALEVGCALEHTTADRAVLVHVLTELVEQLSGHLAARDQGVVLLAGTLQYVGGGRHWLRVGLVQPSASPRQLMELVGLHLETVTLEDEVNHVELRAAVVSHLGERQGELFVDRWPTDPHQLAVLVNRLSSRLGYEQVLRPHLGGSPVPERAVGMEPVAGKADKEKGRRKRPTNESPCLPVSLSPGLAPARPLLLYPDLQLIEVTAIAPDGPPQFVWIEGRRERIVEHRGPERIETLWWRGTSVRRDYYRVATESGNQLWLFRQLADEKWFLHGLFA